jgi:hypothetical protein
MMSVGMLYEGATRLPLHCTVAALAHKLTLTVAILYHQYSGRDVVTVRDIVRAVCVTHLNGSMPVFFSQRILYM